MAAATRETDELHLTLLRERAGGDSSAVIADRHRLTREFVRTATVRIRKADAAESGEDVSRAYW